MDVSTLLFPAELKIDYVRVYQKKGSTNVGCDPKNYPTADYINNHLDAYQSKLLIVSSASLYVLTRIAIDVNMSTWKWTKPKNSLVCLNPLTHSRRCLTSL